MSLRDKYRMPCHKLEISKVQFIIKPTALEHLKINDLSSQLYQV